MLALILVRKNVLEFFLDFSSAFPLILNENLETWKTLTVGKTDPYFSNNFKHYCKVLPCESNPDQCKNGATCTNDNMGGYTCTCPNGYTGINCDTSKHWKKILWTN